MRADLSSTALRALGWATVFVLAGYAGRATIIDGQALSLVWPAAGVAALWLCAARDTRELLLGALGVGTCTVVVNMTTGASPRLALVFLAANLVQVFLFLVLMRRTSPHLAGFGGSEALRRLRDLAALILASTVAALVAATLGTQGLTWALGTGSWDAWLVWWGRNAAGLLVVSTLGLLLLGPALGRAGASTPVLPTLRAALVPRTRRHAVEALVITAVTGVVLELVFVESTTTPLAFLILSATVLAGVRLAPAGAALLGLLTGAAAMAFTVAGMGPFAEVAALHERAVLAQLFVCMTVVTALLLSFSVTARDRALGELEDVVARLRRSEREVTDRAALFAAVLDAMSEGVAVVRADGAVLVRNAAGRRLLGLEGPVSPVVRDAASYGLFDLDGVPVVDAEMPYARALAGQEVLAEDYLVRTADAPDGRVLEIGARPFASLEPDEQLRAIIHFRDVTADRLERDNLASFAGVVAHDLINPLAGVRGWTQVLAEGLETGSLTTEDALAMTRRILLSADQMNQFIDDLLSYSISRDSQITPSPVDLTMVALDVAERRTAASPVRPRITVQEDMYVEADAMLVRQLVDNLVGNAMKYVAPGVRPIIHVSARERDGWLEVSVSDNGIGVPEEMRERVFENFHRAHREGYQGSGLGLAICRRVVQRHGGAIHVEENHVGSGSRFVFTLPMGGVESGIGLVEGAARTA